MTWLLPARHLRRDHFADVLERGVGDGDGRRRDLGRRGLALGDRRARAAKDYLVQVGIPSTQLDVISYGKEKPVCQDHDEACWQRNRRIHIVAMARNQ